MRFFNNIYASYVWLLKELDNHNPRYAAVLLVTASQYLQLGLLIGIIKYFTSIDLVPRFPSKYYVLLVIIPWLILMLLYYSKDRVEKILIGYNEKSKIEKRIWKVLCLLMIIVPIALSGILFRKVA